MRSIPWAMTWEMLSRGRWSLVGGALGANLLPVFLMSALRQTGPVDPQDQSQFVMHLVLVQINMFLFASAVFVAQGSPIRLSAFPISNSTLVTWHMLPAMVLVALETLASTAALNAAFDLNWPLCGPAIFVAVAVAAVQATSWLTDKSAWLPWSLMLVAAVLGLWNKSRYGEMFSMPTRFWMEVTPLEVMTMLAIAGLSYRVAIVGIARQRRGDVWPALGVVAWVERTFDSAPHVGQQFRTPAQAQFWFEWRQKGWAMPLVVTFGLVVIGSCWLVFSRDSQELLPGFFIGGGLLSVLGLVCGMILGSTSPNDSQFEMGHFLATRPLTNTDLANTILKVAAQSVLVAWGIWAVAFLLVYLILLATQSGTQPVFPPGVGWWYFPATLLGLWTVVGLLTSVCLVGRPTLLWKLFCGLIALIMLRPVFPSFVALSYQTQRHIEQSIPVVLGVVFLLGTAWVFVAARRRSLIGSRASGVVASVWGILSTFVVLESTRHSTHPVAVCVFTVGLLALATAPLAVAPLAIAWNRNR